MTIRPAATLAALALVAAALAGCDGPRGYGCADWVQFESPQGAFDAAALVVVGVAEPAGGMVELPTGPGERHRIDVESVLKGGFEGEELWAVAPRDYCVEDPPQPAEDPIPSGERIVLLLHAIGDRDGGDRPADVGRIEEWSGLTPYWTALPFPAGEEPPFDLGR